MQRRMIYLDCLIYSYRNGGDTKDAMTCACNSMHLNCIKFLVDSGLEIDENMCTVAATRGNLDMLIFGHTHGAIWNANICHKAAENGHLSCLG